MNKPVETSNKEKLQALTEKLAHSCYYISSLCDAAEGSVKRLCELESRQASSSYVNKCASLVEEVRQYILYMRDGVLPYIHSLLEKAVNGHDCSKCGGGISCAARRDMQLAEQKQSHIRLRDVLARLQMLALPLYSETIYPDTYRVLRNNMALLENSLGELFFLEETELIPATAARH